MVSYPELSVWVSQEPFPNKEMERRLPEGRFPKGRLSVPKELSHKKNNETKAASLTPLGSNELYSPRISFPWFCVPTQISSSIVIPMIPMC
ncbi:neuronal regeneration-related protein-like [Aotus nancymaae]|uniref:neuronal regeneration-related protein-like n=1 Tax=Aotus nancymaae TaxID=37293 RepID=UPI0030FE798B